MEGQEKQNESNLQFKEERESQNYLKLKRKYKALREEYLKVLENWEDTHKKVKSLSKEKKFLRDKLECFLKSQHYNISDEALTAAILSKNNDIQTNQSQVPSTLAKQSSMQGGGHMSSGNNSAQHQSQAHQNQQKRKKKDSIHQHYSMGQHQHMQPIFGTQDVSKPHSSSSNHGMSGSNHQQIPQQNIFQATNGSQGAPMMNQIQNQQPQFSTYLDPSQQQQRSNPVFGTTNISQNGNRDLQREHHGSKQQMQGQQQQHSPQMMQGQDFSLMNNGIKQISQQSHL